MRLLLDTHIALWLSQGGKELTAAEREFIDLASELSVSAASFWELRLKWNARFSSGERKGPADPIVVRRGLVEYDCNFITVTDDDAVASLEQPIGHSDPFDELLLVQAQQRDSRLLTRDRRLIDHPIALAG